jgi:hypothetical protein
MLSRDLLMSLRNTQCTFPFSLCCFPLRISTLLVCINVTTKLTLSLPPPRLGSTDQVCVPVTFTDSPPLRSKLQYHPGTQKSTYLMLLRFSLARGRLIPISQFSLTKHHIMATAARNRPPWKEPHPGQPSKLKVYNSLTRYKTPFKPIEEGKLSWYSCGPTVYDDAHLGHGR